MGRRRRRWPAPAIVAAGAAGAAVVAVVVGLIIGGVSTTRQDLLWLQAPRDIGRLPARSSWCTVARSAEHCYLLQEASGDASDTGSAAGKWHLSPNGATRQNIHTPIPTTDATGWADTTTERGAFFDGATGAGLQRSTDATNITGDDIVSVTAVLQVQLQSASVRRVWMHRGAGSANGYELDIRDATGRIRMTVRGNSTTINTDGTTTVTDGAPHCITGVFDARSASAARLYVDGTDNVPTGTDMSGASGWSASSAPTMGNHVGLGAFSTDGGVYRLRVDYAAITLAQHQAICGTLWQPPSTDSNALTKLAPADVTWTQTGGTRCYAQSGTTALCIPGGQVAHAYDATLGAIGWALEPTRTNRILWSHDLSNAAWLGSAATPTATAAPSGLLSGYSVTVDDASTLYQVGAGYGASAALYLRAWVKCSTGTLKFAADGASAGSWDVDCATVGGAWAELTSAHAAVTEGASWAAASTGDATLIMTSDATGVTAEIWHPTLTEVNGLSTIPTSGAAVATGAITFEVDTDDATYYEGAKGKITLVGNWVSGACVDITDGSDTGRQYGDATDWFAYDSSDATAFICDMPLSGKDEAVIRWDSTAAVTGAAYAECLLNTVAQSWDATPSAGWTAADPDTIKMDGIGATSCTAYLQTIKIEDTP